MQARKLLTKGRFRVFLRNIFLYTPIAKVAVLLISLWLIFSAALYLTEEGADHSTITSYGKALYWGVAAFSTAGIADMPKTSFGQFIGAIWIIVGSLLFFGAIVSTITAYFMRPMQRPAKQIVETIEYNLEQLEDLSVEELELLKKTTDGLIKHMETLRKRQNHSSKLD